MISMTNKYGQRTRVQNKNLSTDKVKPECQLDQQTKSLTGHIDNQSWPIMFHNTKLMKKLWAHRSC